MQEKKNKRKVFMEHLLFYFMIYAVMFEKHYSGDSYAYNLNPAVNNEGNLALGRLGDYIINRIACSLEFNYVQQQFWVILILIIALAFSTTLVWEKYKDFYNETLPIVDCVFRLSVLVMYANVFVLEWFVVLNYSCNTST